MGAELRHVPRECQGDAERRATGYQSRHSRDVGAAVVDHDSGRGLRHALWKTAGRREREIRLVRNGLRARITRSVCELLPDKEPCPSRSDIPFEMRLVRKTWCASTTGTKSLIIERFSKPFGRLCAGALEL